MTPTVRTFRERLLEHAHRIGDVPAILAPTANLSYGALVGEVHALAVALRSRGIGQGTIVALTARSEVDHLLAALALLELGAPQVALASHDPPALRLRLARRVGATLVLADRPDDAVAGLDRIDLGAALASARATPRGDVVPGLDASRPALYLTGSGTTGEPKVIRFSQHDLARHAGNHINFVGHRVLRPAHVQYNNSKRMRLYTLWQGGTCVFADGTAESLHGQCARHRVTWLELSPLHGADLLAACCRRTRRCGSEGRACRSRCGVRSCPGLRRGSSFPTARRKPRSSRPPVPRCTTSARRLARRPRA
jgi:non-ribosomal peptide synthetase component E (peptide arylation enzyme)